MGSIPEDKGEARFSLGSTEREGQPQFRAFAEFVLEYLHGMGLPEMDKLRRAPEGNTVAPDPNVEPGPYDPDLRRFTLENGQTVYVHLDAGRSQYGYKEIAVLTTQQAEEALVASRAQRSIVAAVTAMEFHTIDVNMLRKALRHIDGQLTKSAEQHRRETAEKMLGREEQDQSVQRRRERAQRSIEFQHDLQTPSLEYVLALLRYSRPGFNSLPRHEQVGLILETCGFLNEFLESLRKLVMFLEYGTPRGLPNQHVTSINRDVRAAILREVAGLSYKEVGEELNIPLPPSSARYGSHDTVSKSVKRGLAFLNNLLGEDGWREQRDSMKADAQQYDALNTQNRSPNPEY